MVTAYRRRRFLRRAVESVVDQGSDAIPVQILAITDFNDPTLDSYLREVGALSFEPAGRALGSWISQVVGATKAPILTFLDDDDLYLPGRIAAIDRQFREDPNLGYYRNAITTFRGDDVPNRASPEFPSGRLWRVGDGAKDSRAIEAMWRAGAAFNHSSIAVRREVIEPFRAELERLEDGYSAFLFYAALVSSFRIGLDPRAWTLYRVHADNESPLVDGPRRLRWGRTLRLAGARSHDADVILDVVRRRRPGLSTRPLERVRARNELYLSWSEAHPSRGRRARDLWHLVRADGLRHLAGDFTTVSLGGWAVVRRRWAPKADAGSEGFDAGEASEGVGAPRDAGHPPA